MGKDFPIAYATRVLVNTEKNYTTERDTLALWHHTGLVRIGPWDRILSDTFMDICILVGIKKIKATRFRPKSNGSNERSHRV
jgi:hypothetical protein